MLHAQGALVISQILGRDAHSLKILFTAHLPPVGFTVFHVEPAEMSVALFVAGGSACVVAAALFEYADVPPPLYARTRYVVRIKLHPPRHSLAAAPPGSLTPNTLGVTQVAEQRISDYWLMGPRKAK